MAHPNKPARVSFPPLSFPPQPQISILFQTVLTSYSYLHRNQIAIAQIHVAENFLLLEKDCLPFCCSKVFVLFL